MPEPSRSRPLQAPRPTPHLEGPDGPDQLAENHEHHGAMSETPGEGFLVVESPGEGYADAVIAAPGGAAGTSPSTTPAFQGRKLGATFWVSVTWLGLMIFLAVFANVLPLDDPNESLVGDPRS